jgi:aspartyl protease family protein
MLLRTVIFAAVAALLATQVPALLQMSEQHAPIAASLEETATPQPASLAPGRVKLQADRRGHFNGTFRFNGKPVDGLVDTGASLVAINESTARKLGFGASSLDFRYSVGTANGNTDAARIILDRVEIGNLRVRGVEAFVMRDKALAGTLVGMSFLKKLKSFEVENGSLTLNQ